MSTSFGIRDRQVNIPVAVLVAGKVSMLFLLAWKRRFVMDEFAQFGWSKYIPRQIAYLAVHHPKAVGYAYFYDVAHLIGWDARSMLFAGRIETALLACVTLAMVYACARSLGETRLRAAAIVLVLLSFSNFIERIFETRAEPLATFYAVAALLVAICGGAELRARRVLAAGAILGLAFLSTQKAVYFDVALGVALVGDAVLAGRPRLAAMRGTWLVLGWALPVVIYCVAFAPANPLSVARNLFFGPMGVASPQIAAEYGGLRGYLAQTLLRNLLLYLFCFSGLIMALNRVRSLERRQRVALIFSVVIAALVFTHNQPWPYVFVMALPFIALWALWPLDAMAGQRHLSAAAIAVLAIAVGASFLRNVAYLRGDNHAQLDLVGRAEALVGPSEVYFDGIGMLPNRMEPSTLWLDRHTILQTLAEGKQSEAYRIFVNSPPKLVIWTYRMDAINPVVGPLVQGSYVRLSPNLLIAGRLLQSEHVSRFSVPVAGSYALYDCDGAAISNDFIIDGKKVHSPVHLARSVINVAAPGGCAFLLPRWDYRGEINDSPDRSDLFADLYS